MLITTTEPTLKESEVQMKPSGFPEYHEDTFDYFKHWNERPLKTIHQAVTIMADEPNAFGVDQRKAILQVVALYLGKAIKGGPKAMVKNDVLSEVIESEILEPK